MTFFLKENIIRSSHSRVFCKKRVLKNFTKFTGNTCVIVHFIKKETLTQVLSCKSCQTFKNTFFVERLRWLLLYNLTLSNSLTKMLVPSLDEHVWNEHEYDVSSWFTCNCAFDSDCAYDVAIHILIFGQRFCGLHWILIFPRCIILDTCVNSEDDTK